MPSQVKLPFSFSLSLWILCGKCDGVSGDIYKKVKLKEKVRVCMGFECLKGKNGVKRGCN